MEWHFVVSMKDVAAVGVTSQLFRKSFNCRYWGIILVRDSSAIQRLFVRLAGAMGRQSALHKENSGFATPTPRMDYAFCLLTLKSSEKWWSPLFGATGNFNHQILPCGILFLIFINTNVFYLLSFQFSR